MPKLITIPKGTTQFKGYDKPRITKSKDYKIGGKFDWIIEFIPSGTEICSNCHYTKARHYCNLDCPEYQRIEY
jgi:hypothetical protein